MILLITSISLINKDTKIWEDLLCFKYVTLPHLYGWWLQDLFTKSISQSPTVIFVWFIISLIFFISLMPYREEISTHSSVSSTFSHIEML